jgi:hypothetical protein
MTVRDRRAVRTESGLERPVLVSDAPTVHHAPRRWRLALAVGSLAVALVGAGLWWNGRGNDTVVVRPAAAPAPAAAQVGVPAALVVHVTSPSTVVAGHRARFTVSYADGSGIYSGSVEDWGETGVGSASQAACTPNAPAAAALHGSYVAAHTWHEAGSYPVSFAVTTYTCKAGHATEETRRARLTVLVAAR